MIKKCLNCDCSLTHEKRNNKFCGSSCAAKYNNQKRKGKYSYKLSEEGLKNLIVSIKKTNDNKKRKPKLCKKCNNTIIGEKRRKFCSKDCKKEYLNDIQKSTTDETREKLSNALKSFYKTEDGIKNRKKLSELGKVRIFSDETKDRLSISGKKRCSNINERIRLRDIGRKGGFGKKGTTDGGTKYQSSFEEKCFDFLEKNNIVFEPHKNLPESSKICDIYFTDRNLWIELDGINREKRKEYLGKDYEYWLNKLQEYKDKNLNFIIFYTYNEFIDFMRL